jgi:ABC-type nickel/cobalt efflux system permease component RcnA
MGIDRATRAFTGLVAGGRLGLTLGLLAFALAVLLGAVHARAPGHGNAAMAADPLGMRGGAGGLGMRGSLGRSLQVALRVTLTRTAGVLVLGVALSVLTALAPERVDPWLGLAGGLTLAGVGVALLRRALPSLPALPSLSARGSVSMGFAGGLVPSPSALVVPLGAIALHRAWFGVLLVVAYGAGMAGTLTAAGVAPVRVRAALDRRALGTAAGAPGAAKRRLGLVAGAPGAARRRLGPVWLDEPAVRALSWALPLATGGVVLLVGLFLAARGAMGI